MDAKDWRKIKLITLDAIGLQESEQQTLLDELKLAPEVRKEVEQLLKFEKSAENWDLLPALDLSKESLSEDSLEKTSPIGTNIGAYEIIGELGYGGMGAVYLAERSVGKSTQTVAVKLLKRELNTSVLRRRFRQEQEILATLEHPNIARLLDVGATDDGIPYLVMEYADGTRIDKYCTENELGLDERLKLFNKVCEAVSVAHHNLIIHRDIKPSNIIVSKDGEPKLLDFGISRTIDASSEATKATTLGAMTPEFASPEQITGSPVSTATDIYSLGVVLFKILTNTMPYEPKDLSTSKLFKEITDSQPTLPSDAFDRDTLTRQDAETGNKEALVPYPIPPFPSSRLKGDLDNIILKSLRKEPKRRYQTVEQFTADVWRHIDGLPVSARPATLVYRAGKFYKRNKIQVVAGSLIVLTLITGVAVAIWQASIARNQARMASAAQQKAQAESAKSKVEEERAKMITEFMGKFIAYANPGTYAAGFDSQGEAKVIDVLGEMGNEIEKEFIGQPEIRAELHHRFAEVYTIRSNTSKDKRTMIERAIYHAQKAFDLRRGTYGNKHELVAKDMYYLWASKYNSGDHHKEELAKLLAEAIQMMRVTNPNDLNLPYMLQNYSSRLWKKKHKEEFDDYFRNAIPKPEVERLALAEKYLEESLSKFRDHYPESNSSVIAGKCYLGIVQIEQGKFTKAEKNFTFCREHTDSKNDKSYREIYSETLEKGLMKRSQLEG